MENKPPTVLANVQNVTLDDLSIATDAYAIEIALGRPATMALNYATAIYVERYPAVQAWDARALIRAAIAEDY